MNEVSRVAVRTVITTAMVDDAFRETAAIAKPQAGEPFRKGDFVVYPTHGVGRVDRVGPEVVAGHRLTVIQISFAENRMVLRIPVVKAAAAGLRKLATPEALAAVMTTLQGRPRASRLMWAKRAMEYQAKINSGDLKALAEVVRDLQSASDGSGTSFSQRNLFELAIDRLAAEVAVISRTDKAVALERLTQALQPGNPAAAGRGVEPAGAETAAVPA
jgi:CarD family transcriptional regulator